MVLKARQASIKKQGRPFPRKRQLTQNQIVLEQSRKYISGLPSIVLEQARLVAEDFTASRWFSQSQKKALIAELSKKTGFPASLLLPNAHK